ncbi:MAG: YibE/F family protein [Atopobiaceae bacterium]
MKSPDNGIQHNDEPGQEERPRPKWDRWHGLPRIHWDWRDVATLAAMVLVSVAVLMYSSSADLSFRMLTADATTYPTATVEQVLGEQLEPEEGTGRYLGTQEIRVRIDTGNSAGQEVELTNSLSATHNVLAKVGGRLVIKAEQQEGLQPYYSVFNYDRGPAILGTLVAFAVLMCAVGGTKGLRSLLGLAFGVLMVACFLLPAVYSGVPALPACLVTAAVITFFSMMLLNGWSTKTYAAIASTLLGVLAAMVAYLVLSAVLQVSGFNQDGAEELILVQQSTGLDVGQTLFAGVMVASLGAVMDLCMSIASALFELADQHPGLSFGDVVRSGFSMGGDMIGTMCQTLVLAFVGSSLPSLLVLMAYGIDLAQLLSSDYLAVELLHSFVGGMAVVLCVPITALVCARFLAGPRRAAAR